MVLDDTVRCSCQLVVARLPNGDASRRRDQAVDISVPRASATLGVNLDSAAQVRDHIDDEAKAIEPRDQDRGVSSTLAPVADSI